MRSPTLHDVARLAGVSIKTVSRVLNNESYVREDTRQRVQGAIDQLGYRLNVAARSLSGTRSYLMAYLGPDDVPFYTERQLRGVMTACQRAGYHVVAEFLDPEHQQTPERIRQLCASMRLDGVVVGPGICDLPAVQQLLDELNIPQVSISPWAPRASPYVYMDDHSAAADMTRYLLDLGHRRIAFFGHTAGWPFAEQRLQGFLTAMREAGMAVPEEYVVDGFFTFRDGQAGAEKLLKLAVPPTAIFCVNDETALGALTCAYQLGLSVPRDISVAGFDDSPLAVIAWPRLTTVHQPVEQMAAAAAERILRILGGEARDCPYGMMLPYKILARGTTAEPRVGE